MLFYVQTNISHYANGVVPVFLVISDDFICLIFSVTTHQNFELYGKITYNFSYDWIYRFNSSINK